MPVIIRGAWDLSLVNRERNVLCGWLSDDVFNVNLLNIELADTSGTSHKKAPAERRCWGDGYNYEHDYFSIGGLACKWH